MQGENVAAFFVDFGVLAEFSGTVATVLFDQHDEEILHGAGQSRVYTITYSSVDFPDIAHGNSVTVDDVSYQVQTVTSLSDGTLRQARMFKP